MALGVEPIDPDVMKEPPRKKNEGVFSHGLLSMNLFRGALLGLTTLWVFTSVFASSQDLGMARTAALFTLVITQLIHVFECKSEEKSLFKIPLFNNIKLVLAVLFSLAILLCCHLSAVLQCDFCNRPAPAKYILRAVLCSFVAPVLSALLFNVLLKSQTPGAVDALFPGMKKCKIQTKTPYPSGYRCFFYRLFVSRPRLCRPLF